jgi:peptidoglycan/LPS O-acetylase OafA/YrhL
MNRLGHRPALDGLRGVAILLVVSAHLFRYPRGGVLGVDIFFVLSGFLITALLLEEQALTGRIGLRAFYRRRALRLLPALFLMLSTCALVATASWASGHLTSQGLLRQFGGIGLGATYTTNIARAWFDVTPAFVTRHLWSLAQEEQFYLLWPIVLTAVFAARRSPRLLASLLCVLFVAQVSYGLVLAHTVDRGAAQHAVWFNPVVRADALVVGCLAGVAFSHRLLPPPPRWALPPAAVVVAVVVAGFDETTPGVYYLRPVFDIAAAILLLRALGAETETARLLSDARLREVGRVSYGVYLWHLPMLHVLPWLIGLPGTFVVAGLSYEYVEKPFLRRKRAPTRRPQPNGADLQAAPATV